MGIPLNNKYCLVKQKPFRRRPRPSASNLTTDTYTHPMSDIGDTMVNLNILVV